jgi:hypothetical protein
MTIAPDFAPEHSPSPPRSVLRRHFLSLSPEEARFAIRGFVSADAARQHALEKIGRTFIHGYNAALSADRVDEVLQCARDISPVERGYAVEGAAFGIAFRDSLPWRRSQLATYVELFQSDFPYLTHVGAGWALGRVPWRRRRILAPLIPLLRPLAFDGLGFHDTYFYHRRLLTGWRRHRSGYAARAYDQGVGRALWFVSGGSATTAIDHIKALPATRQSDLWSGLGLAMAYAGATRDVDVVFAMRSAAPFHDSFAQGVAFACEARARANYIPSHTELAARIVWRQDARALATIVRKERDQARVPDGSSTPRYELWRQRMAAAHHRISATTDRS